MLNFRTKRNLLIIFSILVFLNCIFCLYLFTVDNRLNVKADDALTVESVERIYIEGYNSNPGGFHTDYLITFGGEDDIFDSFDIGSDLTHAFPDLGNKIFHNTSNGTTAITLAGITGYSAVKYSKNVAQITIGIYSGYAKFTFKSGLTLGNYSLAQDKILYIDEYWSSTENEPEYRPVSVFQVANASMMRFEIGFTRNETYNKDKFDTATLNGKSIGDAYGSYWGNWNSGAWTTSVGYGLNDPAALRSELQAKGGVMIFPTGFGGANGTTDRYYGFAIESGVDHSWYYMSNYKWKPINGFADIAIEYVSGTTYSLTLTDTKDLQNITTDSDLINNFSKNEDMTAFMGKWSSLSTQMTIDGTAFTKINGITFRKGEKNQILMTLPTKAGKISINANAVVGNAFIRNGTLYPLLGYADIDLSVNKKDFILTFNNVRDVDGTAQDKDFLSGVNDNENMLDFLNENYPDFFSSISINERLLSAYNDISIIKVQKNQIKIQLNTGIVSVKVADSTVICGAFIENGAYFVRDFDDLPISEISVVGIYKTHSYGYNSKGNQTSFRVEFSDLMGNYISNETGEDVSDYFRSDKFTENFLINGNSLKSILGGTKTLSVYYGVQDKADRLYDPGDTTNSLEFVLSGMQLFDFDVEIKKGCSFADFKIKNEATYRKQYDESFAIKVGEDQQIKVIAIREIPYGNVEYRALRFIFNGDASAAVNINVSFSSIVTKSGAGYFNPETEFGGRSYSLLVKADEYASFITSNKPTITIDGSANFEGTKFVLKNGVFTEENDTNYYVSPAIVEINHPGNQENDLKYLQIIFNNGVNHYLLRNFMIDNFYLNGEKVFNHKISGGWVGPESHWDCKLFYIYVDDNIRNYDGGVDVICIKKGAPIGGGMTIQEDTYFYGVKNVDERDGAYNWKWTFSKEAPELKILSGGITTVAGDTLSATINFDRITNKNDSTLSSYYNNNINVKDKIKINGRLISEYNGATYVWTENGITLNIKVSELSDKYLNVELLGGFTVPNGYSVVNDCSISYGIEECVWAKTFEKTSTVAFKENKVENVPKLNIVRVGGSAVSPETGIKISVKFSQDVVGKQQRTGTLEGWNKYCKIQWLKSITAPYDELLKMTEFGYAGKVNYVGYEYTPEIMDRFIVLGIRDSVLDGIVLNGRTLREIATTDAGKYIQYSSYPVSVDFIEDSIVITVRQDSDVYSQIKDGFILSINKGIVFETETKTITNIAFVLKNGVFVEKNAEVSGITVKNMKSNYYLGQDLDLSRIIAYTVMSDDTRGEDLTVTADMISGFDKNKAGKQILTLTYNGFSATFEVTVIDNGQTEPVKEGCGSAVVGFDAFTFVVICAVLTFIFTGIREKGNKK